MYPNDIIRLDQSDCTKNQVSVLSYYTFNFCHSATVVHAKVEKKTSLFAGSGGSCLFRVVVQRGNAALLGRRQCHSLPRRPLALTPAAV
jgi:hypothetical protein